MADVTLQEVWKIFRDGTEAVRSVTLDVPSGEFFVFLGPSGSGKTTLLRIVAGLDTPTSGHILFDGVDVTEESAKERDVAMIFQSYSLYPHMSVYDNIAFPIRSRKIKKDELDERVRKVARVLDLEELLKKKPRALSGGQQQRVAIGRAIARDPAAFLMDEPLSNLDIRTRASIKNEIARVQREFGVTTLYVTHDQTEALALGDRVGVLREGVLEQVAPPEELHRFPRNLFVAGFVGSPPMNLAEATVEDADDGFFLRFGGHRLPVGGTSIEADDSLRKYAWNRVVVGIRPEDLIEASGGPRDSGAIEAVVARRETVGASVSLFFSVDAPFVLVEDPRRSPDGGSPETIAPGGDQNLWSALVASSDAIEGSGVRLAVRPGRIHLFDPRSGDLIPH